MDMNEAFRKLKDETKDKELKKQIARNGKKPQKKHYHQKDEWYLNYHEKNIITLLSTLVLFTKELAIDIIDKNYKKDIDSLDVFNSILNHTAIRVIDDTYYCVNEDLKDISKLAQKDLEEICRKAL